MSTLPAGHKRLELEDLQRLSIYRGALYWDGQKVKAEIGLNRWQEGLAVAVAVFTVLSMILSSVDTGIKLYKQIWPSDVTASSKKDPPKQQPVSNVDQIKQEQKE